MKIDDIIEYFIKVASFVEEIPHFRGEQDAFNAYARFFAWYFGDERFCDPGEIDNSWLSFHIADALKELRLSNGSEISRFRAEILSAFGHAELCDLTDPVGKNEIRMLQMHYPLEVIRRCGLGRPIADELSQYFFAQDNVILQIFREKIAKPIGWPGLLEKLKAYKEFETQQLDSRDSDNMFFFLTYFKGFADSEKGVFLLEFGARGEGDSPAEKSSITFEGSLNDPFAVTVKIVTSVDMTPWKFEEIVNRWVQP